MGGNDAARPDVPAADVDMPKAWHLLVSICFFMAIAAAVSYGRAYDVTGWVYVLIVALTVMLGFRVCVATGDRADACDRSGHTQVGIGAARMVSTGTLCSSGSLDGNILGPRTLALIDCTAAGRLKVPTVRRDTYHPNQ